MFYFYLVVEKSLLMNTITYLQSASSGSKNQTTARVKLTITYEDLEKTYLPFSWIFSTFYMLLILSQSGYNIFSTQHLFFLFFMISFSRQVCTAFFTNRYVFSWILWTKLVKDFLALPDLTTNFQVNNF